MVEDMHLEEIRCHLFQSGTHQTLCFISQGTPILKTSRHFGSYSAIGILTMSEVSRQELSFANCCVY